MSYLESLFWILVGIAIETALKLIYAITKKIRLLLHSVITNKKMFDFCSLLQTAQNKKITMDAL